MYLSFEGRLEELYDILLSQNLGDDNLTEEDEIFGWNLSFVFASKQNRKESGGRCEQARVKMIRIRGRHFHIF